MTQPPPAVDQLPPAAAVLLARLLTPATTLPALRKDVAAVTGAMTDDAWAAAVAQLTTGGFAVASPSQRGSSAKAKPAPLHLTGDGRTAARERLGALADAHRLTATKVAAHPAFSHASPPSPSTVLLARLYVPDKSPLSDAALRKFVAGVIGTPVDDDAWSAAKAKLVSAGYTNDTTPPPPPPAPTVKATKPSPLSLTDAGRSAAVAWLGMDPVPPTLSWKLVRDRWLPATVVPAEQRAAYRDDKRVVPLLVGQALDVGPADSVEAAVAAAVCRDVGYPQCRTIDELISAVLSKRLGKSIPPLTAKARATLAVTSVLGTPDAKPATVRAAALKRWAAGATDSDAEPKPASEVPRRPGPTDDLSTFAAGVNAAAAASKSGRWGDDKVFISHVHRQLNDGSDLTAFKRRLVEANTAGLVRLARADLVAAMDPADVRQSEATHPLGAEFHFVRVQ